MRLTTRFAPTPSGYLHIGNCTTFAITWLMTRVIDGKIYLRIDDLDEERTRDAYIEDIFKTLKWLELDYDEGPRNVEDFKKNFSQHLRVDVYKKYLNRLTEKNAVYACTCSRQDIRKISPDGTYPQTCRDLNIPLDTPDAAWRIKTPTNKKINFKEFFGEHSLAIDDFIVRQKNGLSAYHLASVVDDCSSQINFIARGEDLLPSSAAQIYLSEQIGLNTFKENLFVHLPLIRQATGEKISKSTNNVGQWKLEHTQGEREFIFKFAANWLKIPTKKFTAAEVLKIYKENFSKT